MIILLDTSTADCQLTIYDNDKKILEDSWQVDRELAEKLISYLEAQFALVGKTWNDIDGIGLMKGPGSFTGLRIGASIVNALSADRHIPIVGVIGNDWQNQVLSRLAAGDNDQVVLPEYGRPARITTPRK